MNRIIKKSLQAMMLVPMLALGLSVVVPAFVPATAYAQTDGNCGAVTEGIDGGVDCAKTDDQPMGLFADGGVFETIVNVLLFVIGAVAVIMLVYGGIRYVLSGGDASAVTAAKNTILYAVVGIIVAILAYAIVQFVIDTFRAQ